jgi:hypothetical protein
VFFLSGNFSKTSKSDDGIQAIGNLWRESRGGALYEPEGKKLVPLQVFITRI